MYLEWRRGKWLLGFWIVPIQSNSYFPPLIQSNQLPTIFRVTVTEPPPAGIERADGKASAHYKVVEVDSVT